MTITAIGIAIIVGALGSMAIRIAIEQVEQEKEFMRIKNNK